MDGPDWISIVTILAQRDDGVLLGQKEDMTVLASGGIECEMLKDLAFSLLQKEILLPLPNAISMGPFRKFASVILNLSYDDPKLPTLILKLSAGTASKNSQ